MTDDENDRARLSLKECEDLFAQLFPRGPAGDDVLAEAAPGGWAASELVKVAHPSPETLFNEAARMHHNIEQLFGSRKDQPPSPPPTLEEIRASYHEKPIDVRRECAELIGRCMWDVFSDNHDVIAPGGRVADIGSFRGAGGFIADWLNALRTGEHYDYMDFYMGTIWAAGRADLSPLYRMIFRRLKVLGCDWHYSFPRLGVVRFNPPFDDAKPDDTGYDPGAALEKERVETASQKEFEEMQEGLRQSYNKSVREARTLPPPEIVKAYMNVYACKPPGWPPEEDVE